METSTREISDQLMEILEKNRDAEKGYFKAIENTEEASLSRYFERKAQDRKDFNNSLHREMVSSYESYKNDGSFKGAIHSTWMDVKSFFTGNDDKAMLEESIRGDKAALEEYEEILKENTLPIGIAKLLREQKSEIERGLAQHKNLEDIRT